MWFLCCRNSYVGNISLFYEMEEKLKKVPVPIMLNLYSTVIFVLAVKYANGLNHLVGALVGRRVYRKSQVSSFVVSTFFLQIWRLMSMHSCIAYEVFMSVILVQWILFLFLIQMMMISDFLMTNLRLWHRNFVTHQFLRLNLGNQSKSCSWFHVSNLLCVSNLGWTFPPSPIPPKKEDEKKP